VPQPANTGPPADTGKPVDVGKQLTPGTAETIGQVQQVNLEIYQDATLSFDIEWWEDTRNTKPIAISAVSGKLRIGDTAYDLDQLGYATFEGNKIHIALPDTFTATLPAGSGKWRIAATDAVSQDERVLARGLVKVRS